MSALADIDTAVIPPESCAVPPLKDWFRNLSAISGLVSGREHAYLWPTGCRSGPVTGVRQENLQQEQQRLDRITKP